MESPVTCLVSRHCFLCLGLGLVLIFVCQSLSCFHVSSWLVSYDCVLIVSLSVVAQFLFCVETLAFVADSWSMYLFTCWSLTYCKLYHALITVPWQFLSVSSILTATTAWTHCYNTHTHTLPFNGPFSGTTQVSRYQKGKTNLDFSEARDSE